MAGWGLSANIVHFDAVEIGRAPRVVGIISHLQSVGSFLENPEPGCDVVELRLDRMDVDGGDWESAARALGAAGYPVIATLRIPEEGGEWQGGDEARLPYFERALTCCAAVDIELRSSLCAALAGLAEAQGKALIVSHHDYEQTPGLEVLQAVEQRAALSAGVVVKIAVRVQIAADVECLKLFLAQPRQQPLCLIGMGDLGIPTRLEFPSLGSCLAYGHLDGSTAPGQLSCRELSARIRG